MVMKPTRALARPQTPRPLAAFPRTRHAVQLSSPNGDRASDFGLDLPEPMFRVIAYKSTPRT